MCEGILLEKCGQSIEAGKGFDEEYGQCFTYTKVRGRNKSLNKLIELGKERAEINSCDAYNVHGNTKDDAIKVYDLLKKVPGIKNVYLVGQMISAIVGVYSGPGTIGVCYVEN